MEKADSVLLLEAIDARRRKFTHEDGSTEDVLGLFITVKRSVDGVLLEMQLPEILVQLHAALKLPGAIHDALARHFPDELSAWIAANHQSGSASTDLH